MKLYWHYKYVNKQKQILSDDIIDTTPDKFGRWQISMKVFVDQTVITNDLITDDLPIQAALIMYDEFIDKFKCNSIRVSMNDIDHEWLYADTPRELIDKVEAQFKHSVQLINSLV